MQMRMEKQVLSPTVQYGEKADLGAQMLGIGSDGGQGLGRGAEENAVEEIFVLVRPHAPLGAPPSMKIEFSGLVCGDGSVCGTSNGGWRLLGGRVTLCGRR